MFRPLEHTFFVIPNENSLNYLFSKVYGLLNFEIIKLKIIKIITY